MLQDIIKIVFYTRLVCRLTSHQYTWLMHDGHHDISVCSRCGQYVIAV